jgi:hypothetical protein
MANLKDIAATLAILGSGALALGGCDKDKPATEVPGAEAPAAPEAPGAEGMGEASCSADSHPEEGHCNGDKAEGEGEGSCSADGDGE